jgi:hypothetical protein
MNGPAIAAVTSKAPNARYPDAISRHVNRADPVETGFSGAGMSRETLGLEGRQV